MAHLKTRKGRKRSMTMSERSRRKTSRGRWKTEKNKNKKMEGTEEQKEEAPTLLLPDLDQQVLPFLHKIEELPVLCRLHSPP